MLDGETPALARNYGKDVFEISTPFGCLLNEIVLDNF